jgi:glycosyltransferase involved in cell wall biosynthesis
VNIGIYSGGELPQPEDGGAFGFTGTIFEAIAEFNWREKKLYIFHSQKENPTSKNSAVTFVSLADFSCQNYNVSCECKKTYGNKNFITSIKSLLRTLLTRKKRHNSICDKNRLNRACEYYGVGVVWFPTPCFEPVSIPYFITVWDLEHRKQPYFPEVSISGNTFESREKFYAPVLQKAAKIIIGNSVGAHDVSQFYGVPLSHIACIEFPVPSYCSKMSQQINLDVLLEIPKPYLFYPAQFWPHKNHVVIIDALKNLQEAGHEFRVVFTGADKGNLEYIKTYVRDLVLEKMVSFLGFVNQQTLISLYQNAFCLVFASYFGPNNLPPLEAMQLGCPVISALYEGAQEQLGEAGLYFKPFDSLVLAKSIIRLYTEPGLRESLLAKGQALAQARSAENYIRAIDKLFEEFLQIRKCWSFDQRYKHL